MVWRLMTSMDKMETSNGARMVNIYSMLNVKKCLNSAKFEPVLVSRFKVMRTKIIAFCILYLPNYITSSVRPVAVLVIRESENGYD